MRAARSAVPHPSRHSSGTGFTPRSSVRHRRPPPAYDGETPRTLRTEESGAYGKGLLLVRPDGCISRAGEDTSGLGGYAGPPSLDLKFA